MKAALLILVLVISCTPAIASQKHAQKKKSELCWDVMERVKTSYKHELFVGFARKEVVRKVRKDFSDLHTHVVPAFKTCLKGGIYPEGSIQDLLMITVKDTPTNAKRLRTYSIKNAG
jgi:hypothetical protein